MAAILKTVALRKHFGSFVAVDGVDLEVHEGDLYGFLGLNGAGKTTTIRMILQLIRPTAGEVFLFGKNVAGHFKEVMRQVGALVELPAYYPYLSAVKNLEILALMSGGVPKGRIEEVLELVGLGERMHQKVRTYSQGMRQRLGIAMALLCKPRLVILDEPSNGLDPQGINYIRNTILEMNKKDGITFVISSHLLHEVEITCTRVGIIRRGKLLVQDTVAKLLAETAGTVRVVARPLERLLDVLPQIRHVKELQRGEDGSVRVTLHEPKYSELNAALVQAGLAVEEFTPVRMSLEEYFLSKQG